jgi:hypothetical protein
MFAGLYKVIAVSMILGINLLVVGLPGPLSQYGQGTHYPDLSGTDAINPIWLISGNQPTPRGSPKDENSTGSGGRA